MIDLFLNSSSWLSKLRAALHVVAGALLFLLLVLIVTTPIYVRKAKESVPLVSRGQAPSVPTLGDLASYQTIVNEHPAFGIPKQKPTGPIVSACDQLKVKYTLAGIIGGTEMEALFNSKVGGQTTMVKAGEVVEGVTVEAIYPEKVILNCSGKQVDLMIEET